MTKVKKHKTSISFIRRQYMQTKDYEVFYYNDIKIDTIEQHYHTHYELYFFLEGEVKYTIDGTSYDLKSGDVLLIPPNKIHGPTIINNENSYCRFVLWIDVDLMNTLSNLTPDMLYGMEFSQKNKIYCHHLDYIHFNELFNDFLSLWYEYNENNTFKKAIIINHIVTIILKTNRIIHDTFNTVGTTPKKELYSLILDYINQNITSDLTLEEIANNFYVSKYYISHIFKENLGISLHQYIIKKRLSYCKGAIARGESITAVASKFGFTDYTGFYRAFKKEYGISPKDYQKEKSLK